MSQIYVLKRPFLTHSLDHVKRDKRTPPTIIETPAINVEEDEIDNEVVLRPSRFTAVTSNEEAMLSNVVNKRLQLDSPYFTQRPASENDIFTISSPKERLTLASVSSTSDVNRISMTPEVPSITFAHLPKNYLDTPAIEEFKKQEMTLAELQARESEFRKSEVDFSMPRYYGKSELMLNSSNLSIASLASVSSLAKKHVEKSRLKQLRAHIPPLMIHKDKQEKEK